MLHRLANDDNRVFFITEREGCLSTGKKTPSQKSLCLALAPAFVEPLIMKTDESGDDAF